MTSVAQTFADLRKPDQDWQDYVEYLNDTFKTPNPDRKDYEDFQEYYTALMTHNRETGVKSQVNILLALAESLRATDMPTVELLTIEYYGGGDSGEIQDVSCYNSVEETMVNVITDELDRDLREGLDDAGWALAYNLHPGFEISDGQADGGQGVIRIQRENNTWSVSVDHQDRAVVFHEYLHEFS